MEKNKNIEIEEWLKIIHSENNSKKDLFCGLVIRDYQTMMKKDKKKKLEFKVWLDGEEKKFKTFGELVNEKDFLFSIRGEVYLLKEGAVIENFDKSFYVCYMDFDQVSVRKKDGSLNLENLIIDYHQFSSGEIIPINEQKLVKSIFCDSKITKIATEEKKKIEKKEKEEKEKIETIQEQERVEKLNVAQSSILQELDKDNNGEVDVVEGDDFNTLLKKHQKKVVEIDRSYIQNFVKVANHLKTQKNNIQLEFSAISQTKDQNELEEQYNLLKNQIHGYELVLFHSLNMIVSLVDDDLITFYEIYEAFDKLGIWNSNWENDISGQLTNIGDGLTELMYSINKMESNIVREIGHLTYVTQESFGELSQSVSKQLSDIDSSLKVNNLLTGISAYQMYKINKNTKPS